MSNCDQARRICSISLPLLAAAVFCLGAQAEERIEDHKFEVNPLPSFTKALKARRYKSIKYSKGFKVKGLKFRDNIYFGGVKVNGEYGPGLVVDNGSYVWGFNHERIEFQLRF